MNYKGIALTMAGSDSGGGAGIQADLKTFQAFSVFGVSAVTSITAQNTLGVRSVQDINPGIVGDQIDMIMEDMGCHAAKTGMVSNTEIIEVIADRVQRYSIDKLVVDPVMAAKGGDRLLKKAAENNLIKKLLPLSYLLTPNVTEAEIISGLKISGIQDAIKAAGIIVDLGAQNILIKGARLKENKAIDLFYTDKQHTVLESEKIETQNIHGTGCTLSAAITAALARGHSLTDAVTMAKAYVTRAIKSAPDIGKGFGPLYHKITPSSVSVENM